jgi:hypothetical protein
MKNYYVYLMYMNGTTKRIECGDDFLHAMDIQAKYVRKKGIKVAEVRHD